MASGFDHRLSDLRCRVAAQWVSLSLLRLRLVLRAYDPNQPRVPAGSGHESGRWTSGGERSGSSRVRIAQGDRLQGYPVDLREEDAAGGHTIQEHVGKRPEYLVERVRREQSETTNARNWADGLSVGSFPTLDAATRLVNSTLARNQRSVDQVASGTLPFKMIDAQFESITGYEAYARTERSQPYIRETHGVSVFLRHDPSSDRGFRIITAFPTNP